MILSLLCLTMAKYGKPNKIRTDNEAIFNSRIFKSFLKSVNVVHQPIPKASPWCNGRIERLFGTLKSILRLYRFQNNSQFEQMLHRFVYWYNYCRPHQGIDGKIPEYVWRYGNRKKRKLLKCSKLSK
ncbi:integrase core domain-containing protein [Faucicola mancuniensis]|uniref:integrase core domain-containing protein n=1 Tax=Faucicola mancuniensis TaxID=1309795 RepID=UPI003977CC71